MTWAWRRAAHSIAAWMVTGAMIAGSEVAAGFAVAAQPGGDPAVAPVFGRYTADWRGITVGTSDLDLKTDAAPGAYIYTWDRDGSRNLPQSS